MSALQVGSAGNPPQTPVPWGKSTMLCVRTILLCTAMAAQMPAQAQAQAAGVDIVRRGWFTPGELALLPDVCKDIQGSPTYDGPRGNYWRSIIGDSLSHLHHYCRGVRDMIFARTLSLPPEHKRLLWDRAAGEMKYVIERSPPTMMLQPELWLRVGESMLELGRLPDAQQAFEQSRKLKPDYWPAYVRWADVLIDSRKLDEARQLLEEGLKHSPDQPELVKRMARVNGGR